MYLSHSPMILLVCEKKLLRWNTQLKKFITPLIHRGEIQQIDPDSLSTRLLTYASPNTVNCWNLSTSRLEHSFNFQEDNVVSTEFSPDNKKILVTLEDSVMVFDAGNYRNLGLVKTGSFVEKFGDAFFSADSKEILTSVVDLGMTAWNWETGEKINRYTGRNYFLKTFLNKNRSRIFTTSQNSVTIWDYKTSRIEADLESHSIGTFNLALSPDKKYLATISEDKRVRVWDHSTLTPLHLLPEQQAWGNALIFTPDNKRLITENDEEINIWGLDPLKIRNTIETEHAAMFARLSPDRKKLVTAYETAKIWDIQTGKMISEFAGHKTRSTISYADISSDGNWAVTSSSDKTAKVWEVATGKELLTVDNNAWIGSAIFSPDASHVLVNNYRLLSYWDIKAGTQEWMVTSTDEITLTGFSPDNQYCFFGGKAGFSIKNLKTGDMQRLSVSEASLRDIAFNSDGQTISAIGNDFILRTWDIKSAREVTNVSPGLLRFDSTFILASENKIVTLNDQKTVEFHDIRTGKLSYSLFVIDSSGYLIMLPDGYYMASKNAARTLHYVSEKLDVTSFEQLDLKYNRPDKVLTAIGSKDRKLIESYKKAWQKRMKRMGIDTLAFREGLTVPGLEIVNRNSFAPEQIEEKLTLRIHGADQNKLERYNVWVNGIPLYGHSGISLKANNYQQFDTTATIDLSSGDNIIEASVVNENGIESYRMPISVRYSPAKRKKEKLYFIGIGIDQFADSSHNLSFSAKDIRDLAIKFKDKFGEDIIIDTFFNANVKLDKVRRLKQMLRQTTVNDKVIIAYSGHGLLSRDFDYFLSTYDIDFDNPEKNGLSYDDLENLLDSIPARKKLMLIDACHSGEVDKEELIRISSGTDSLVAKKGLEPVSLKQGDGQFGMKNSFELMQSLFVNVSKSTGATIISAAAGTQFALERNDLKNGVFTYSILEALRDNSSITVNELKRIASNKVQQLTNGLQQPTSRHENLYDWKLW